MSNIINKSIQVAHVKNIYSHDSGGGFMIDAIVLQDDRVLGISDESVCLYECEDHLLSGKIIRSAYLDLNTPDTHVIQDIQDIVDGKHDKPASKLNIPINETRIKEKGLKKMDEIRQHYADGLYSYDEFIREMLWMLNGQRKVLVQEAKDVLANLGA